MFLFFQVFVPIHGRGIGDFAGHQYPLCRRFDNSLTNRLPPGGRLALEQTKPFPPTPDVELDELERRTAAGRYRGRGRSRRDALEGPLTRACPAGIPEREADPSADVDGGARADAGPGTRPCRAGLGDPRQGDRGGRGSEGCGKMGAESRGSVAGFVASLAGNIGVALRKADE